MCDTNGASLPHQIAEAVRAVRRALPDAALGIHTHNDAECAVANSLAAIAEGAVLVQGTMNGYGERCGNANLISIIPNLQLKMGYACLPSLEGLTEASHLVAEMLNLQPDAEPGLRGQERVRAQGRDARRGRQRRPVDVRAHRPGRGRQRARGAGLASSPARAP